MTADELTLDRVKELLKQAKLVSDGGHRTASDRLLQHRKLIEALEFVVTKYERESNIEFEIKLAVFQMMKALKKYPLTYDVKPGEKVQYRWAVKSAGEFDAAVALLLSLALQADNLGR